MTQEQKQLLLKALCAMSLYEVKCLCDSGDRPLTIAYINRGKVHIEEYPQPTYDIDAVKPYLRPISSITEEEEREVNGLLSEVYDFTFRMDELLELIQMQKEIPFHYIDWLNSHHFDYRGLIEKGLALEAPEDMYQIN